MSSNNNSGPTPLLSPTSLSTPLAIPSPTPSPFSALASTPPASLSAPSASSSSTIISTTTSFLPPPSLSPFASTSTTPATTTTTSTSTSTLTREKGVVKLDVPFKHGNDTPIADFLQGAAHHLGRSDFTLPLKLLASHWVDTVSDLRLLVAENQLRDLSLPIRLCVWIEAELASLATPAQVATPIVLPADTAQNNNFFFNSNTINGNGNSYNNNNDLVKRSDSSANNDLPPSREPSPMLPLPIQFAYVSAFDTNGIMHYLGTKLGTQEWQNPMDLDQVFVTSSGMMRDSERAACVVGRSCVRCVTQSAEGAWIKIEVRNFVVRPSAYSLKHYSSWDTECLRDWKLEAAVDDVNYVVLYSHKADQSLTGKGGTATWNFHLDDLGLPPTLQWFRFFKLTMTGANSNNHMYLCCSGFELYGQLYPLTQFNPSSPPHLLKLNKLDRKASFYPINTNDMVDGDVASQQNVNHEFTFVSDFDTNGILYALGSINGTMPWKNPADLGLVRIIASSLMDDSEPANAVVGREIVRCVTKPEPNAFFIIDFNDKTVQVSQYSMRHYSTWDVEALRSWRFEGSMDKTSWYALRIHVNDDSLNTKGGTKTWPILDTVAQRKSFRYLRILQTGENSNHHLYLALSGFEVYGRLLAEDGVSPASIAAPLPRLVFTPSATPFDDRGILYWIGTAENARAWQNPMSVGPVLVTASSVADDSEALTAVVGRSTVRCVTQPHPNSWMQIDLVNYFVQPSAYSLRHYASWDTEALRNWDLLASVDGLDWVMLSHHDNDTALEKKGSTHTWKIDCDRFYRVFRLFQTGVNSNKHHYLACSGFELYGVVRTGGAPTPQVAPPLPIRQSSAAKSVDLTAQLAGQASPIVPSTANKFATLPTPITPPTSLPPQAAATPAAMSLAQPQLAPSVDTWDADNHGSYISVNPATMCRNAGSSDKWQMVRTSRVLTTGVERVAIKLFHDPPTTNTWRFIIGVIPGAFDVKGPKQWVGAAGSWGYISGTGGKCRNNATSLPYGQKFGGDDTITIELNFNAGTIEFFKNGESQGIAFNDLVGPVYVAASLTANESALQLVSPLIGARAHWDSNFRSSSLVVEDGTLNVRNAGSSDKWQSIRSVKLFAEDNGDGPIQKFDAIIVEAPATPNSWRLIVGVVPPTFTCSGSKQWVGAGESWGYIGGTGGKCYNQPKTIPYGDTYSKGDVITVQLNWTNKTIEFFKNGISQGIAFEGIRGPVHAAVSLTATGAVARLRLY